MSHPHRSEIIKWDPSWRDSFYRTIPNKHCDAFLAWANDGAIIEYREGIGWVRLHNQTDVRFYMHHDYRVAPNKIEISAIEIEYADGDVKQLSLEDARTLYKQLDELFGQYVASQPFYIEPDRHPWRPMFDTPEIGTPIFDTPTPGTPQIWCLKDD